MRVIVAGGGSAGLAAAVAAARAGAQTLLLERHGSLGGMATAALVHSICGLYFLREEPGALPAHPGFPSTLVRCLQEAGGAGEPVRLGRVDVLLTRPPIFAAVADRIAATQPNLSVRFHTELIGVERCGDRIQAVEVICRGRRERLEGEAFVDTSGDATLAHLAGVPCEIAPKLQRPAMIFPMGGVKLLLDGDERMRLARSLISATRSGQLPQGVLGAHFRPGAERGEVWVTLDLDDPPGGLAFDPFCPEALSAAERYGRELALELAAFLKEERSGFEGSYIAAWPARVGVRESRRVVGRYRLEEADLLRGASFPDAVARSTWPIELRETTHGPRLRFPEGGRACDIPLRALRPEGMDHLFVAGRALSASHEAQAALRVIGTCLATGEAAGYAAAMAAKGGEPKASDIRVACEMETNLPY